MIEFNKYHKALAVFNLIGLGSLLIGFEYAWIAYWFLIIFAIPMLLAKHFFRAPAFSTHTIIGFIIYPILYVLILAGVNLLNGTNLVYLITAVLLIGIFNYLAISVLKNEKQNHVELSKLAITFALFSFVFLFIRQIDSILALDYLQHLTVTDKLFNDGMFCALPGECSNLFLQQGYSTFYHIIQGFLVIIPQVDLTKAFFVLDLVWGLIFIATIYSVSKSLKFSINESLFIAIVSAFTFINGAYEQTFFVPQTLAFWFFILTIFDTGKIKIPQILASSLIIASHFVIGVYLVGFLILSQIISKLHISKLLSHKIIINIGSLLVILSVLLAGYGFSFEDTFQRDAVDVIGSFTNPPFDDSVRIFLATFSHLIILAIVSLLVIYKSKEVKASIITSVSFTAFSITLFFTGITYSNKFLIGLGIFLLILIVHAANVIKVSQSVKYVSAMTIIAISILSLYANFDSYSAFYGQNDGTVSAVSERDLNLVDEVVEISDDCIVLSDPYTQIILSGYKGFDSARSQYMLLETREALVDFVTSPTIEGLDIIKESDPAIFENKSICFVLSSRLTNSVLSSTDYWKNNIYSYPIENSLAIKNSQEIRSFFANNNYTITYRDSHFILFEPNNE